jgi:predicted metal-dependent enzyme (double-stranded beta helix superfamily)
VATTLHDATVRELIDRLDGAVRTGDVRRTTREVKHLLETYCARGPELLPSSLRAPRPEGYARRLLHRDPQLGYTVVVMTWGPGQGTELHDHAGIWCVECVLDGELDVTQYDLVEQRDERYKFVRRQHVRAGVGTAGCLIPPFEYHTLTNALADRPTVTVHVYGGEMDICHLYRPDEAGTFTRVTKRLDYAS